MTLVRISNRLAVLSNALSSYASATRTAAYAFHEFAYTAGEHMTATADLSSPRVIASHQMVIWKSFKEQKKGIGQ